MTCFVCVLVMGSDAALERMKIFTLVSQNWIWHCQAVANENSSPCNSCC